MRESTERVKEFSKYINENMSVFEEIQEQVAHRLFIKFITADNTTREEIGAILNAQSLFASEIASIIADNITDIN